MITHKQLLAAGWNRTIDEVYLFEKKIENRNPINASEDSEIKFIIHGMYNVWTVAVIFPDGGLLNFFVTSIEKLKQLEKMIDFYDPPF